MADWCKYATLTATQLSAYEKISVLYPVNLGMSLKAGEPATLNVSVTVKGESDFVMIEVPIPAGCSYYNKRQSYYEDYREYNYDKVSIFCQHLNKGTVNFQIELMPRYTGTYQLNPARAELMYFPVFYGHEGMKSIKIE